MTAIITDAEIGDLRRRYNVAYAAYRSCAMTTIEAIWNGKTLTPNS